MGKKGIILRKSVSVPYNQITNIDIIETLFERSFGIGQIHIQTAGASVRDSGGAELVLLGIKNPENLKNIILEKIKLSKVR